MAKERGLSVITYKEKTYDSWKDVVKSFPAMWVVFSRVDFDGTRVKAGNIWAILPDEEIIDFENEINAEIDRLVDIKREITCLINGVSNPEEQTLLELRYLCFKTWEQIAVDMGYSLQNVYKLHSKALKNLPND